MHRHETFWQRNAISIGFRVRNVRAGRAGMVVNRVRQRPVVFRRSGQEAEADEDGDVDGRHGGGQHDDDEGDGRHQAVHHPLVLRHQAGPDRGRVPVAVQGDGDEENAVQADQMGVAAAVAAL